MPDDNAVAELVQQISGYLRDNPLACDTQEGIARWWLAEGTACDDHTLLRALQRLQRLELVEQLRAADGRVRYRRIAPAASGAEGGAQGNARDGARNDEAHADAGDTAQATLHPIGDSEE